MLLVLSLLPICGLADVNSEYLAELQLLNEYMKTAGENAPVGIEKICDQIEGNGRIGEYTVEFGIYANVLRLLEAEDYTGALAEAGDLLNGSSFEEFRAYLEDGEELRSWGLYALDSVERLYSYVQGRAAEASDDWKKAVQYYSACEQFMDARTRKQFANLVTPTPSPTPTPTAKLPLKLTSSGLYRLFPEIEFDTDPEDGKSILKNRYGFDEVDVEIESDRIEYLAYEGEYLGIPVDGRIDVYTSSQGSDCWDEAVCFEDEEAGFNAMLKVLNQTIGKPDFGIIKLYEFGYSEFKEGKGRHELRHLTTDELCNGTCSSMIALSRLSSAEHVEILIYWGSLCLGICEYLGGYLPSGLSAGDSVYTDYAEDVFEGEESADRPVLQRSDKGTEVALLQKELIERNYLYDVANGSFGAKTEQAVIKLQSDAGLPQTGVVDDATWKALGSHIAKFVAQEDMGLVLYALEFEEDGTLRYYVKNMGSRTVADWELKVIQCNASKQAIGDFSGKKGSWWKYSPSSCSLEPGNTASRYADLKEGETGVHSNGRSYTVTYFSDAKYAGAWLTSYTTEDGKKHNISGMKRMKLYAEIIR